MWDISAKNSTPSSIQRSNATPLKTSYQSLPECMKLLLEPGEDYDKMQATQGT
jgi:hypothetical protein